MKPTLAQIQSLLEEILRSMDDVIPSLPEELGEQTALGADLNLSSLDVMHVLASVDMHLGRPFEYEPLLMPGGQFATDLTLGQVARYLWEHYDEGDSEPRPMG